MKRSHFVIALPSALVALVFVAAACGNGSDSADKKQVSTYDPNATQNGDGEGGAVSSTAVPEGGIADATIPDAIVDQFREVKTPAQALQVLLTAYANEVSTGTMGVNDGTTPPVKAFSADVVQEGKNGKARINALANTLGLTPEATTLSDRMAFQGQATVSSLGNVFQNMFNQSYVTQIKTDGDNLVRTIDSDITPILTDDDKDLKTAVATTRDETEARISRANEVMNGLRNGGDDGMFADDNGAPAAPTTTPAATNNAAAGDGGTAAAAPAAAANAPAVVNALLKKSAR